MTVVMVVKVVSVRCRGSVILNYCIPDGHLHMLPQRASAMHVLIVFTRFITVVLSTACVFVLATEIRGVRLQEETSAVVWEVAKRKKNGVNGLKPLSYTGNRPLCTSGEMDTLLLFTAWSRCPVPVTAASFRVAR